MLLRRSDMFILSGLLSFALIPAARPCHAQEGSRPNVLWIVADDLSPDLGCYGEKLVATPNIDRLASEGIRYTRAFATSPVCSPARSALVTGVYQTSIGAHHHRTRKMKPLPPGVKTVMQVFSDAGYYVTNQGKTDYNFVVHGPSGEPVANLFDAMDWKKREPNQPFFAQVQIKEPHRTFHKDTDVARAAKIKLSPKYPDHWMARADWANYLASIEILDQKVGNLLDDLDRSSVAENTVVFFFGDHGRPHVWGKQWLYDGGLHIPLIIRLPRGIKRDRATAGTVDALVSMLDIAPTSLAVAGLSPPESMVGRNLLADDFKGHERLFAARDRCGDAVDRIRSVRDGRFKYIRNFMPQRPYTQLSGYKKLQYPVVTLMHELNRSGELTPAQTNWMSSTRPNEELYDLQDDPHELVNLADKPRYARTLREMREHLQRWILDSDDQGQESEGDAAFMEALTKEKRAYYQRAMKRRNLDPDLTDQEYLLWWKGQLRD